MTRLERNPIAPHDPSGSFLGPPYDLPYPDPLNKFGYPSGPSARSQVTMLSGLVTRQAGAAADLVRGATRGRPGGAKPALTRSGYLVIAGEAAGHYRRNMISPAGYGLAGHKPCFTGQKRYLTRKAPI